jgi:hypothetical protein
MTSQSSPHGFFAFIRLNLLFIISFVSYIWVKGQNRQGRGRGHGRGGRASVVLG